MPIDALLEQGQLTGTANGYEVRLPPGDAKWELANQFMKEEAACCASLALEVEERPDAIIVRASF